MPMVTSISRRKFLGLGRSLDETINADSSNNDLKQDKAAVEQIYVTRRDLLGAYLENLYTAFLEGYYQK